MTKTLRKIDNTKSIKVSSKRKKSKTITQELLERYAKTFEALSRYDKGERPQFEVK